MKRDAPIGRPQGNIKLMFEENSQKRHRELYWRLRASEVSETVSQWARGLVWSPGGRRKTILRAYGFLMTFYAIFVFLSRSKARKTT